LGRLPGVYVPTIYKHKLQATIHHLWFSSHYSHTPKKVINPLNNLVTTQATPKIELIGEQKTQPTTFFGGTFLQLISLYGYICIRGRYS